MHEVEIQNWLNHARSIGYTDKDIRAMMLKAGWSNKQVNDAMVRRGLAPGSAAHNPKGKIVPRRVETHGKALLRHYLTIALLIIVGVSVWIVVYWAWRQ